MTESSQPRPPVLTEFGVGQYQAFATLQRVPLKPITLVFGPNSAGKSALLRSLLVAKHAILRGRLSKTADADERHPGRLSDMRRGGRHCHLQFEFSASVVDADGSTHHHLSAVEWNEGEDERIETTSLRLERDGELVARFGIKPKIHGLEAEALGPELGRLLAEVPCPISQGHEEWEKVLEFQRHFRLAATRAIPGTTPTDWLQVHLPSDDGPEFAQLMLETFEEFQGEGSGDPEKLLKGRKSWSEVYDAVSAFREAGRKSIADEVSVTELALRQTLGAMDYHGPQRPVPDTISKDDKDNSSLKAWWQLAADPALLAELNEWFESDAFQTKHRLDFDRLFVASDFEALVASLKGELKFAKVVKAAFEAKFTQDGQFQGRLIEDALDAWDLWDDKNPEASDYSTRGHAEGAAWDILMNEALEHGWREYNRLCEEGDWGGTLEFLLRGVNHLRGEYSRSLSAPWVKFERADVRFVDLASKTRIRPGNLGFGFSQMVPLVVSAFAAENRLIVIEQPELHVHPALQTELADRFIESAMNRNNRYLIETHSEHLILRVMRRIRETFENTLPEGKARITKDEVCVLYVEPGPDGSIVREMPLNERGDLVKGWPGGFFEEALNEL